MKKIIVSTLIFISIAFSLPYWDQEDFEKAQLIPKAEPVMQYDVDMVRGNWQTWSYIHELCQTAAFIGSLQVADSLSPDYGGIIEGEDEPDIVQTDNTQEAIWVWCRHYEITGDTTYFVNLRRAWIYVMNFPAYDEEGSDSDYYRVWNCGLALFAETKYRGVLGDTSFLSYADTCAKYIMDHPLPFDDPLPIYQRLHPKVTSMAAGMLYQYGKEMSNQTFKDTALVFADSVRIWIEADPNVNINDEAWAMSGGTAVWGLCRSLFDADTSTGITWLNTYLPYMKYYQPTGNWNNSWNIWYANAYNYAARIVQSGTYVDYHHSLADSLLIQDYDDDGGVPPTRTWGQDQDHAWVSAYMVFMGFEGLMDSIKDIDVGVNYFIATGPRPYLLIDDSVDIAIKVANFGFQPLSNVYFEVTGSYSADTIIDLGIGEQDTIRFTDPWIPSDTGYYDFESFSILSGDERAENDTLNRTVRVRPLLLVIGALVDSTIGSGIGAELYFQFADDTGSVYIDSAMADSATGMFSLHLLDSLYRAFIFTCIPYPDFSEDSIYVTIDSISDLDFYLIPTDLLVINRDDQARYDEYYRISLDSLNITYKIWAPVDQGIFPISRVSTFNKYAILWYTGDAMTDNITAEEQDSLMFFLDNGGKLLLTGQNIGEEIHGTPFFNDYLHAQLVNDSIDIVYVFPDTLDALGQDAGKLFTVGASGASNQYSRDVIGTDGQAHEFLFYDSTFSDCAGIWYDDQATGYQLVYFGFGIEAVHRRPNYMTRTQLLGVLFEWLGIIGIAEYQKDTFQNPLCNIYPNPFRDRINITFNTAYKGEFIQLKIYDVAGRLVKDLSCLAPGALYPMNITWRGDDNMGCQVPRGVYFISLKTKSIDVSHKTVVLK
jgi:hypothetical protein